MQQTHEGEYRNMDSQLVDAEKYPAGLRWNHTVGELEQMAKTTQAQLEGIVKSIENLPKSSHSYKNTIIPMQ